MSQVQVDIGSAPNAGDGDPARTAFTKVNDNATDAENRLTSLESGGAGDMLKSVYDPTTVEGDAFSMGNMAETATSKVLTNTERTNITNNTTASHAAVTLNADSKTQDAIALSGQEIQIKEDVYDKANETGIEQIQGSTILTPPSLSSDQDNYNPTGFSTANMLRLNPTSDIEISGFLAPPAGVNRIISLNNITTNGKKIKLLHNDSGSLAANRILNRDENDRTLKANDGGSLWYDHTDSRWRSYTRIG